MFQIGPLTFRPYDFNGKDEMELGVSVQVLSQKKSSSTMGNGGGEETEKGSL
jgi:hypothetical protein